MIRGEKPVYGVTAMRGEVFLVRDEVAEVEVYDADTFAPLRQIPVKGLIHPVDIASSVIDNSLYIVNAVRTMFRDDNTIHRTELKGQTTKWAVKGTIGGISVDAGGETVTVTCNDSHKLKQFTSNGHLIRVVRLKDNVMHPWHAVPLTAGQFLVSHGWASDKMKRVCVVDIHGGVTRFFCGTDDLRTAMYAPHHLAVDRNGVALVADGKRILSVRYSSMEGSELLSLEDIKCSGTVLRLCLNESGERLYVTTCDRDRKTGDVLSLELTKAAA